MIIAKALESVEDVLRGIVKSDVGLLSKASGHVLLSGGKRLRPRLVLLSYEAIGKKNPSPAVPAAAAVELIHTASLIHDDINDKSDMRRGEETINARWGNSLALLAGDFVFIKFLKLLCAFDSTVIRILSDACADLVEGETLQMLNGQDGKMDEQLYLMIASRKTASLFSACAELGAVVAGGTAGQVASLKKYGHNLGIAFQIRDDILDLVGKKGDLGKPVANDLKQGKMSLPILFVLNRSAREREYLLTQGKTQVIELLQKSGALDYAMQRAKEYSCRAQEALSSLAESEARAGLHRLADYAVTRKR